MTVALVVVSHSRKIAEGAVELAAQMAPDVRFYPVGGTDDGRIGTDLERTIAAFEAGLAEASGDGVVVLTDLGSAVLTAESAMEFCSEPDRVLLADAPLVEGLVAAAVAAQGGAAAASVKADAESIRFGPDPTLAPPGRLNPRAGVSRRKATNSSSSTLWECTPGLRRKLRVDLPAWTPRQRLTASMARRLWNL